MCVPIHKICLIRWNGKEGRKLGQEDKEKRERRNMHPTGEKNKTEREMRETKAKKPLEFFHPE